MSAASASEAQLTLAPSRFGIKETTPVFQRQSRHAQTIILAISYAEAMQMHAKSRFFIDFGNQLGRSGNARAF